jgi:mono/diheme cytochrome c family protein
MRLSSLRAVVTIFAAAATAGTCLSAEPPAAEREASQDKVDFARDVRPILQRHCFKCHSGDKREGGFRLDLRTSAMAGGDEGIAIKKGDSENSSLIKRVTGDDPDLVMPPEGDRLTPDEVSTLTKWIDQGAVWPDAAAGGNVRPDHWSYQPIVRPDFPQTRNRTWARNDVDAFVLSKLESLKIAPSPEAHRYTLIRRLYLDLLGLPPHPDEVDAFVNDESPKAYDQLVSKLLMSPHFGERWGRHWLDMARYADSDGYEKDSARPNAWRWRNWVINAINQDIPFDQFTIEQLAGDLLPDATADQKLATAFHRQTLTNTEGGTDQEQFRVEACFDRTETTGAVWLGLTVGCARCHTHKYDAITQREYYQLFGFFNNGDETNLDVPISDEASLKYERDLAAHDSKIAKQQEAIGQLRKTLAPQLPAWEDNYQTQVATLKMLGKSSINWHVADLESAKASSDAKFTRQEDGSYLVEDAPGKSTPDKDEYTLLLRAPAGEITGLRVETIPDKRLPASGAGRAQNGNFVLSDVRVYSAATRELKKEHRQTLAAAHADFSQEKFPPAHAIDGDVAKTGWAVSPKMTEAHAAEFLTVGPLPELKEQWIQVVLDQQYGGQHTIGRFRVSIRTGSHPSDGLPKDVLAILDIPTDRRSKKQNSQLLDWFVRQDAKGKALTEQIEASQKDAPKPPVMSVRVLAQRVSSPRTTHVLRRGEFLDPIKDQTIVPTGLSVMHDLKARDEKPADRLDLARWLASSSNPLTPRVTVNHVWKHLFGEGIVRTVNDFGVRGDKPSHPELLDWLADEFRGNHGWSRKELIRTIVTSATYRQTSVSRPELKDVDPQNLLLARQNRTRVEAEVIRDLSLSVSGLLSEKIGGPSVFPPLPPGVAELSYANNFKWATSKGEDRYRRGLYTFFKRTSPHPNLTLFDCPDSNLTCVSRNSSNTPLQALTLLNNEIFVEAAREFGQRTLKHDGSDRSRLTQAFRLCVSRQPTAAELDQFQEMLTASRKWYEANKDAALALALARPGTKSGSANNDNEEFEAAAWIATCRIMLNMDEFITRN